MKSNEQEKALLQKNLMTAVRNCKKLLVGHQLLESSFKIEPISFIDFTDEKYEDGVHSYKMNSLIKVIKTNEKWIEENCDIHFDAKIDGVNVTIEKEQVTAERNIIPYNFDKI